MGIKSADGSKEVSPRDKNFYNLLTSNGYVHETIKFDKGPKRAWHVPKIEIEGMLSETSDDDDLI